METDQKPMSVEEEKAIRDLIERHISKVGSCRCFGCALLPLIRSLDERARKAEAALASEKHSHEMTRGLHRLDREALERRNEEIERIKAIKPAYLSNGHTPECNGAAEDLKCYCAQKSASNTFKRFKR